MPNLKLLTLDDDGLEQLRDEVYGKLQGLNKDDAFELLESVKNRIDNFSVVGPQIKD